MKQNSALVDDIQDLRIEGQGKRAKGQGNIMRVHFASGTDARLDLSKPRDRVWGEVLESLRDAGEPAYVEIDFASRYITSLLIPRKFLVTGIREVPGGADLEIELEISHARHYLRRENSRFDALHDMLERARREKKRVLVTESLDSSAIIDVRPAPSDKAQRRR